MARILIVDDEPTITVLLSEVIRSMDHNPEPFSNARRVFCTVSR